MMLTPVPAIKKAEFLSSAGYICHKVKLVFIVVLFYLQLFLTLHVRIFCQIFCKSLRAVEGVTQDVTCIAIRFQLCSSFLYEGG